MNVLKCTGPLEIITIGLQPGEMLLESVRQVCRDHEIRNGVVISGIGALKTARMHHIKDTQFPPTDVFYKLDKPLELTGVSGIIADGEPHLHITVACGKERTWAGHLEPGCEVAYLAEIAIIKCNDLKMTRREDAERGIKLLGPCQ